MGTKVHTQEAMKPWRFWHFHKASREQVWRDAYVAGARDIAIIFGIPVDPLVEQIWAEGEDPILLEQLEGLRRELEDSHATLHH